MIINSRLYSGPCACGRDHSIETQVAIVEAGCLTKAEDYFAEYEMEGFRVAV